VKPPSPCRATKPSAFFRCPVEITSDISCHGAPLVSCCATSAHEPHAVLSTTSTEGPAAAGASAGGQPDGARPSRAVARR
jgi:hypothetical protein